MSDEDIDISSLTKEQVVAGVGDVLLNLLITNKIAVCAMSSSNSVTFLNPLIVRFIPAEELAKVLLEAWEDDEVVEFLEHVYG